GGEDDDDGAAWSERMGGWRRCVDGDGSGSGCHGEDGGDGWRVVASGVVDLIDPGGRNVFGLCGMKGIKWEFSVPRTPQQNGIAERINRTLIEAARTILADSLLSIPFWAEAVNTACYVQNRVLVTRPHNKTLYKLLHNRTPSIGFMRPFGCHVTILNTLHSLGKFEGKVDEGFLVGYSVKCSGPTWLFDIDSLTRAMNYQPVTARNQTNPSAGFQDKFDAEKAGEEIDQRYVLFPVWSSDFTNPQNYDGDAAFDGNEHDLDAKKPELKVSVSPSISAQSRKLYDKTKKEAKGKSHVESFRGYRDLSTDFEDCSDNSINEVNTAELEDITYSDDEDDVGVEADLNNLETSITVSLIPTTRVHKDYLVSQIIGNLSSTTQTRSMTRVVKNQGGLSQMFNDDFHTCMFACFLLQEESKRVHQALKDQSWIEAMQEELLQFKMQKVWILVDLPHGKRAIVARIEAIRLVLAYASFMGFMVYQMDVKSAFLYGTIEEEVYVCQPSGFEDPNHPDKVYKLVKALYGLHQAPRACDSPLLGVNTPRSDKDRIELMELTVFLLRKVEKVRIRVNVVDLQVSAVGHMLLLLVHKLLLFKTDELVNDVTRLQALVDKKKVVITEAAIREVLCLDDAKGVDCLPNEEIFTELARMGYEKPSTKLTFYKAFFSSQWNKRQVGDLLTHTTKYASPALTQKEEGDAAEHVEDVTAGDDAHGDDSAAHREIPTVQKTPPQSPQVQPPSPQPQPQPQQAADFPMSLLREALDACAALTKRVEHLEYDKVAQALEITKLKRRVKKLEKRNKVRVLKLRKLQRVGTSHRVHTSNDTVMDDESNQGRMIAKMDKDDDVFLMNDKEEDKKVEEAKVDESAQEDETEPAKVQEVVDVVTTAKLIIEVVTAASETVTTFSVIIPTAEPQVHAATLIAALVRVDVAPSRRRKGVIIRDPKEESTISIIIPAETKYKDKVKGILVEEPKPLKKKQQIEQDEQYARELHAKMNKDIDWDEAIDHVKKKAKEDLVVQRYQVLKRKPQNEAQARKNIIVYLKNVTGFKMDYFKGMSYDDIRLIFEAKFNSNVDFLLKTKEKIVEEENRALQTINETPAKKAAKRIKLNEEVEDLKIHLQIVPNEDDDVYTKATPLARKLILLLERRYLLSRFTLDQMLNAVRLQVEEESEVSLELLRFTRQQHQECQHE
nr:hypothetical protein [Tanacetum cinerariifolium]